jgi:hypothetical protein
MPSASAVLVCTLAIGLGWVAAATGMAEAASDSGAIRAPATAATNHRITNLPTSSESRLGTNVRQVYRSVLDDLSESG